MIEFLPLGPYFGNTLDQSYSVTLVVLSYLIAALASYAGLLMSACIANAESSRGQWLWLAGGAGAMGIGVWAMHFTGMLALSIPVPVSYNVPLTVASVIPAMLASGLALRIMSSPGNSHYRYLLGGTLVGAGIGAMHYIGMAAMIAEACRHPYDPLLFLLSIVVAVSLGIAAFYIDDLRRRREAQRVHLLFSAGLLGLAIAGMHYTAMAAVAFVPDPAAGAVGATVGTFWLSVGVTTVSVTIAALAIVATIVGRAFQATTQRARVDRERIIDAIDSINDGFTLFDDRGNLTMCNDILHKIYPELAKILKPGTQYKDLVTAWARLHDEFPGGVTAEAFIEESLRNFREGRHSGQPREERLNDGRWIYSREHSIKHGGLVSILTDITVIKELQAVYERMASQDTLTGLLSRRFFDDRLDHAIALAKRLGQTLALLYVDLDHFKPVNDAFGHDVGDAVLREIAQRLRQAARDSDTVARLGGDEFAVLMESDCGEAGAATLASRIIDSISQPIFAAGHECRVGASIGIAIWSAQTADKDALIKAADEAMYDAKRAGRGQYRVMGDPLEPHQTGSR
ncbi:MAG TPA: diguanylate cyclase [Stellaceae bacterium]|jgi:diguanylate cyclase (GGDEF)-like protein|nr:diguanylate cyclase [Stellaceae bacterium]